MASLDPLSTDDRKSIRRQVYLAALLLDSTWKIVEEAGAAVVPSLRGELREEIQHVLGLVVKRLGRLLNQGQIEYFDTDVPAARWLGEVRSLVNQLILLDEMLRRWPPDEAGLPQFLQYVGIQRDLAVKCLDPERMLEGKPQPVTTKEAAKLVGVKPATFNNVKTKASNSGDPAQKQTSHGEFDYRLLRPWMARWWSTKAAMLPERWPPPSVQ